MKPIEKITKIFVAIWHRAAAVVAIVLIALAFIIGVRVGSPASEPSVDNQQHSTHESEAPQESTQYYTCSMHPSVRLTDPDAKCPICFMDLIPVDDHAGGEGGATLTLSKLSAESARVETAEVTRFYPVSNQLLYGTVGYDMTTAATLTAYFPGRIEELYVNFVGVPVEPNDHLAEIYSPDLIASFEELRQASIAYESASEASGVFRDSAMQTLQAARERLRLFGIDQDQVDQVESEGFNRDVFTIHSPIGGIVTEISVREGDYIKTGDPIAKVADLDYLWLDLHAYESQLPYLHWGQRVEFSVQAHPGETYEGRISFIDPDVDPLLRTSVVRVAVHNAEHQLKPGMFASATVHAQVNEYGTVIEEGSGDRWVCPMHPTFVQDTPGTCDICSMDLVPSKDLIAKRLVQDSSPSLVIPASSVLFTGRRSVVYVAEDDEDQNQINYTAREVVLGPRAESFYTVRSGLVEGERVVTNGAFRIDSAMQISAKPSMMSHSSDSSEHEAEHSLVTRELLPLYEAYFDAQAALATDDLGAFISAGSMIQHAAHAIPTAVFKDNEIEIWRSSMPSFMGLDESADIEAARVRFASLSKSMLTLMHEFGNAEEESVFVAHCPMAFDFDGADWIQRGKDIRNPYFGASMLQCGDITAELLPADSKTGGFDTPSKGAGGHHHE